MRPRPGRYKQTFACGCALLLSSLALLVPLSSRGQTIQKVTDSGNNTVSEGGTVYINPASSSDYPMPELNVSFSGLPAKAKVTVYIKMSWNDPYNTQQNSSCGGTTYTTCLTTPTQTVYADCSGNANVTFDGEYNWGLPNTYGSEGADNNDAEIHWTANGTAENGFSFNIGGDNVNGTTTEDGIGVSVDYWYSNEAGAPWFWGNILAQESSGEQYCPSGRSYCTATFPNVHGSSNPRTDGIGISQIDGTANAVGDGDYWNLQANIQDAINIVNADLNGGPDPPSVFWPNQVSQAGSGNPPPSSGPPNGGTALTYCEFGPTPGGNVHSWEDAEWITSYNGTGGVPNTYLRGYYIYWNQTLGAWEFNIYSNPPNGGNGSYVGDVCNKAPY